MEHDEHPGEAQEDHGQAHEDGVAEEPQCGHVSERVEDDRKLEADEHEQERVQQVLDDLPHCAPLEPHLRARQLGRVPAEVDAGRHGGEHRGDPHQVGGNERDVAGEKRDRDLRRRVVQPTTNLADEPSDSEAEGDSAAGCDQKGRPCRAAEKEPVTTAATATR